MLRMEMGRLGVCRRIAQRNQRDRNVIFGKIQLFLQRLVVETAHPAGAEALFGGFQLDVIDDDGAVDRTNRFAFMVVPAGFGIAQASLLRITNSKSYSFAPKFTPRLTSFIFT